jgi:hypothetical protein
LVRKVAEPFEGNNRFESYNQFEGNNSFEGHYPFEGNNPFKGDKYVMVGIGGIPENAWLHGCCPLKMPSYSTLKF